MPTSNAASAATLHRRIAEYICRLRFDDLPDEVVEQAKEMLVYHLGLAFSGYFTEIGAQARAVARELGRGSGDATVIGERFRAPPVDAVIANASLMRELRLDDVLFPAGVHPGLVILPVALALGEQQRCTGQDLLTAIVVGYDVIGTLGGLAWAWSAPLPRRPTIPYGAFGPTAAAARLLGLDAEQTSRAVGYAAHFAMGIPEGDLPSHYYGLVARNGIMAATLARLGGVVAPTVLEGRFGFFNSFLGAVPAGVEDALAGLGRRFQIMGTTTKRYPGTALNIVPIQLALDMVATDGCTAENVAAIRVFLSDLRRNFSDGHSKGPFASRLYASSSLPFGLALSLLDGRLDDDRYDQFDSPEIRAVIDKMTVILEPDRPLRYTRLEVDTFDGRTLYRDDDSFQFGGHDWLPWLSRDGERLLSSAKIRTLLQVMADLERVQDVHELTACLVPEQHPTQDEPATRPAT